MDMTKVMSFSQSSLQAVKGGKSTDITESIRPVAKGRAASSEQTQNEDTFGSALDKAKDTDVETKQPVKAGKEKTAADAADATTQEAPTDPLSAALAASQQASSTAEPAASAATAEELPANALADAVVQEAASLVTTEKAVPVQQTAGQAALAETQSAKGLPNTALEALLSGNQDTAQSGDAQQLLELLSGNTAALKNVGQTDVPLQTPAQEISLTQQPVINSLAEGTTPQAALLAAVNPTVLPVTEGKAEGTQVQTNTIVSAALQGAALTVEDRTQNQGDMLQQDLQQDKQQGGQNLQQAIQQENIPVLQNTQPADTSQVQTAVTPQLPEEAATDKAPQASAETTTTAAAAGSFQQNLQNVSAADKGAVAAQTSQPQTNYDIPRQIVEQARIIKSVEDTQMVIKLKPEHLGELTLKVSVTANGSVNASFHTDNAQVRGIIESSMVQLKQELQAQGLKVDNVGVYAGLSDGFLADSQQGQAGYSQQQSTSVRNQQADLASFEEAAESVPIATGGTSVTGSDDGIDYRI